MDVINRRAGRVESAMMDINQWMINFLFIA
jgi:hypothetical protein